MFVLHSVEVSESRGLRIVCGVCECVKMHIISLSIDTNILFTASLKTSYSSNI